MFILFVDILNLYYSLSQFPQIQHFAVSLETKRSTPVSEGSPTGAIAVG